MSVIKLALAKGRLAEETLKLLERAGISCPEMKEKSRKLVFRDQSGMYEFIMVKPSDVPTYVDWRSWTRPKTKVKRQRRILQMRAILYNDANGIPRARENKPCCL